MIFYEKYIGIQPTSQTVSRSDSDLLLETFLRENLDPKCFYENLDPYQTHP